MTKPTLYVLPSSMPCRLVQLTFELMKIDHEVKWITIEELFKKTDELWSSNPLGRVPALKTDNSFIFESGAIVTWALNKTNLFCGKNDDEKNQVISWLFYIVGDLLQPLFRAMIPVYHPSKVPMLRLKYKKHKKAKKEYVGMMKMRLENYLKDREYLVGDSLTVADIALVNLTEGIFRFSLRPKQRAEIPNVSAWVKKMANRKEFRSMILPLEYSEDKFPIYKFKGEKKK